MKKWISDKCSNMNCQIICGDFNCSLSNDDRLVPNIDRSRPQFSKFIDYLDLTDMYKLHNPHKKGFTYSNKKGDSQSRIDYFFCTPYLAGLSNKCYLINPPKIPDHKMIICTLRDEIKIGKSYWKLNVTLLENAEFRQNIIDTIKYVKDTYKNEIDNRKLWDICKHEIKNVSIRHSSQLSRKHKTEMNIIENKINELDDRLSDTTDPEILKILTREKDELRKKVDEISIQKAAGAQIRSRAKWVEKGEKNTNFFLNLEKHRQTNNRFACIKKANGNLLWSSEEMLNEGASFYSKLYSSKNLKKDDILNYLNGIQTHKTLTNIEADLCEGLITEKECFDVITKLKSNKSPGYDGLPSEFYKTFWPEVKDLVLNSFNESFRVGELSETHKQIIISLIFKKGERTLLKNYRPLSLSNTDYKILAFVLANRLHKVLKKLISPEQVAYIKGRYIGQNIRLVLDIIKKAKDENKEAILLFLDYEKAFDSIEWDFIHLCLKKMGFKENFCRWLQVIYTKPKAFLKMNGFLSKSINIERGIRQGCPLSCLVFIICLELLNLQIKQNDQLEGFSIDNEREIKILQYADDTSLFMKELNQVPKFIEAVNTFSKVTGLSLNLEKTEGIHIRGHHYITDNNLFNIKWTKDPIRYLGIFIGISEIDCIKKNWTDKLESFQKLIDSWRKRKLTLFGKVIVIKTLALPKLIFSASMLPLPDGFIKKVNVILYKYIWGNSEKIKRQVCINNLSKGGLGMIDLQSHFEALKASWINRIYDGSNLSWAVMPNYYINKVTCGLLGEMNFKSVKAFPHLKDIPLFYQEVILSYAKCQNQNIIQTKNDFFNECLWGNCNFKFKNRCLFDVDFINAGIIHVKDILYENGLLKQNVYQRIENKQRYFEIISNIQRAMLKYDGIRYMNDFVNIRNVENRITTNRKCKDYYNELVKSVRIESKANSKWASIIDFEAEWTYIYQNKLKNQLDMKILEFNFKVLNDILATKSNLFKWKISPNADCIYCGNIEDISHLLFYCRQPRNIWTRVSAFFSFQITLKEIIFGVSNENEVNTVISYICYAIYKKYLIDKSNVDNFYDLHMFIRKDIRDRLLLMRYFDKVPELLVQIMSDLVAYL